MAILLVRLLSVLGLLQLMLKAGDQPDKATQELMEQREIMLQEEMRVLLEEIEKGTEPKSGNSALLMFLSMCHHWQFWALAEALLALFGMYWLPKKTNNDISGDSEPWSSSRDGEEEQEVEEEELREEDKEQEERNFKDQHDPELLMSLLGKSLLPKLFMMQSIMEEVAGENSASANSIQRTIFMRELQAEVALFVTMFENNLPVSSLACSNAKVHGSPRIFKLPPKNTFED